MRPSILTNRQRIQLGISVLVTLVFVTYVLYGEGAERLASIFSNVDGTGVLLYVLIGLLGIVIRAMRYRVLLTSVLGRSGTPSSVQLLLTTVIRNALADFLPARLGEVAYVYMLNRFGVRVATGASTFGFCIALDLIVLFLIILLFFIGSGAGGLFFGGSSSFGAAELFGNRVILSIVVILGIVLILVGLVAALPWLLRTCCRILARASSLFSNRPSLRRAVAWVEDNIGHIAADLDKIERSSNLLRLVFLTALLRITKYGSLYILLLSVVKQWGLTHADFSVLLTTVAFISAEASASLPISGIMGFGAYETSWGAVFALSGITLPYAPQVAFAVHLITQVKAYTLGLVSILYMVLLQGEKKRSN